MTKEEVIAAIKESTTKLGYVPSFAELQGAARVSPWDIRRNFQTYGRALKSTGLERQGAGYPLDQRSMFVKWAEVVRNVRKIPSVSEYEEHAKRQARPMARRCGT